VDGSVVVFEDNDTAADGTANDAPVPPTTVAAAATAGDATDVVAVAVVAVGVAAAVPLAVGAASGRAGVEGDGAAEGFLLSLRCGSNNDVTHSLFACLTILSISSCDGNNWKMGRPGRCRSLYSTQPGNA
jgi:hypothetical protein